MIVSHLSHVDSRIPKELQETYSHLAGIALNTLRALDEWKILFGASKEAVDLMNQTAPDFFMHHQNLLFDHIVLSVSRLTDDKRSGSRKNPQENLTLACLLDLEPTKYPKLHEDLCKRWTVIQARAKPIRLFRHKVIAHTSRVHRLLPSTELTKGITLKSIKDLLNEINAYLVTFECSFTGVDTPLQCPASFGDAADLLGYLRLAVDAEKKQNEGLRGR